MQQQISERSRFGRQLRDNGYRLTPQRLMILEAVAEQAGHLTVEDIHERVVQQYPEISLSTIYRTLETLRGLGLVTQTDMGNGREEYHFAEQAHHHHLVCTACGKVQDLDQCAIADVMRELSEATGYQVEGHWLELYGRCAGCRVAVPVGAGA